MHKVFTAGCFAAFVSCLSVPALADSDLDAASLNALKSYTLSMDKISAMQAAMDEAKKMPAVMQQQKSVGSDAKSIAEMEAKLNAMPQAVALYHKHGLTTHDAVVMTFVLMDAGVAASYPSAAAKLSDRMSPAQVAFYKQHQAELKKMSWLSGSE
jgi:hypothetical protein